MKPFIPLFFLFLLACAPKNEHDKTKKSPEKTPPLAGKITTDSVENAIRKGDFSRAEKMIWAIARNDTSSTQTRYRVFFLNDLMHRIGLDFSLSENQIKKFLKKYYPALSDSQLRQWEKSKALEMKIIDGERKYFKYAGYNLFRIDPKAKQHKIATDGEKIDPLDVFLQKHLPTVVEKAKTKPGEPVSPVKMKLRYTVSLKPGAVPRGEVVRCWLPFPRKHTRQQQVKLINTNAENYLISPPENLHSTIYFEKTSQGDKPTVFQLEFQIQTFAQWFDLENADIQPYKTGSELYKKYTAQRPPHIVFSEKIKKLSAKIAPQGNPYQKVKQIYLWIDQNIPWASALEYSTFENIPAYVLENRHGDCGMQTLLFIALARYNGIPAKWQSGWMLHPGEVNLHDWAEVYYEGIGWVPLDQSFEIQDFENPELKYFFTNGIDAYRLIVNEDYSQRFFPAKIYPRSETVDFQRGELEWKAGNLYFDQWSYQMDVEYLN